MALSNSPSREAASGQSQSAARGKCEKCGSSRGLAIYADHTYCFSCGEADREPGAAPPAPSGPSAGRLLRAENYHPLTARKITEATRRKFGYFSSTSERGVDVEVAEFRAPNGALLAQKARLPDKNFVIIKAKAEPFDWPLFGQHVWGGGGKRLIITEGEIDALSVAQVLGLSWPVVSLPNGAQASVKAIKENYEYVTSFESVLICFDMDNPGRKAASEAAAVLPPGKAKIVELPRKDANEMLVAGDEKALVSCIYNARVYRPDGIINAQDLRGRLKERVAFGRPYPWPRLTSMTYGQHDGTLVVWTAGTGVGKTTLLRQVAYEAAFPPDGAEPAVVGMLMLEEGIVRTAQGFLSMHLGKQTHLPGATTDGEIDRAFDETLASGRVNLYDHFGSLEGDTLMSRLNYLIRALGCRTVVLDHISIATSGLGVEVDERRLLDRLMTQLRSLVEGTGATLHLVSHLKRTNDTAHEDGGSVSLSHLRGSQAIAQLADLVIAAERNITEPGSGTNLRVLKNRLTGVTGEAGLLVYDPRTGRFTEKEPANREDAIEF